MICVCFKQSDQNPRRNISLGVVGLTRHNFTVLKDCGEASGFSHHNGFDKLTLLVPTRPLHTPLPWASKPGGGRGRVSSSSKVGRGRPPKTSELLPFFKA